MMQHAVDVNRYCSEVIPLLLLIRFYVRKQCD